jgi:hypothetical protein
MAEKIVDYMSNHGTKFMRSCSPTSIEKDGDKLRVTWFNQSINKQESVNFIINIIFFVVTNLKY